MEQPLATTPQATSARDFLRADLRTVGVVIDPVISEVLEVPVADLRTVGVEIEPVILGTASKKTPSIDS